MGRRRWRFAIAAVLLLVVTNGRCQDENDYYYTPERNFAQVQPPIFPNSRPSTFFEHESFRIAPTAQQNNFNEGRVRFPTPNYNQNPSPFQLPTGRSQSGTQYYINQPEFPPSQRQRFRPALPYNFQLVHPASTKRPETSQIHSVAYQNDPSKPETFLGQITINNPDIEILQSNRFKNIPFDGNSLKINGQSGHISHGDDIDNEDEDIFERHKVTTYNPTKLGGKQVILKPSSARFSNLNKPNSDFKPVIPVPLTRYDTNSLKNEKTEVNSYKGSSTEYKSLLDIEPLLEDDISDLSSFRELMKKTGSFDVEVIKSNSSKTNDDSKPDATSMHSDNIPKSSLMTITIPSNKTKVPTPAITSGESTYENNDEDLKDGDSENTEAEYEYYEDDETLDTNHTTTHRPASPSSTSTENITDIYDEYDSTEEDDKSSEVKVNATKSFDVLNMQPNNTTTLVKDDNFKQFKDTTVIDQSNSRDDTSAPSLKLTFSNEEFSSIESPSILGQEVVSVVTTKSVVNGTISIPEVTYPSTSKTTTIKSAGNTSDDSSNDTSITTESWIVVASVQTSRSVSGARFLPFPTVEQEEKKQVIADDEEDESEEDTVTENPRSESLNSSSSTENINDKLDSIQSELSSAVLSGELDNENKNIELIKEATSESTSSSTSTTTTASPVNVFTLKSKQYTPITERSSPDPLPVLIKKFTPRPSSSTTPKPKKKPSFVTIMDDLSGFLPPGFKSRQSYKDKRITSTTTTTQRPTTKSLVASTEKTIANGTQGRSSGISSKNKVIILDDKSLLPKEYKPRERSQEDIIKKLPKDDLSKLLPPGYKPSISDTTKPDILGNIEKIDITAILPKVFKPNSTTLTETTTEKPQSKIKIPLNAAPIDITALLPPGFKLNSSENETEPLKKVVLADISNLLPPGFNLNASEEVPEPTTTKAPGGFKLVFPSRPGGKNTRKSTTQKSSMGPQPVTPKIHKGWPTRASTEFTGWPSPSTTPFSIERLLEMQRNAISSSPLPEISTEITTKRYISTTTTTQSPPPPTTPGVCRQECDIAATIKIVAGVKWVPELLDQHTKEWKNLAKDVKEELNSVYSKSDLLRKWFKGIRIDGFSQGSVLVDYFIELNNVEEKVDTVQLKRLFHKSLHEAKLGSVMETEAVPEFDTDSMQGDQPDEDRFGKSDKQMTKTIDKSAGKLEIGKFVMDPAYTEFIVLPKRGEPTIVASDEESLLPQWGIAVIVIAMASLLFVVIFGVTVLVNRQKSAKTKQPIPLSEDMLRELDKSHMGGFDDVHQLKERDLPYLPSGKRMSTAFIEQLAYPNPGDSWRSEWTPQAQKYMQHYTADSGRGSQVYGATGNGYGYGGSQIYGQTGGGSQVYGYTGEYPRSHYSRRRSEYDSNF